MRQLNGWNVDAKPYRDLQSAQQIFLKLLLKQANLNENGKLSLSVWSRMFAGIATDTINHGRPPRTLSTFTQILFRCIGSKGNNSISLNEYTAYLRASHCDVNPCKLFESIKLDHDDKLGIIDFEDMLMSFLLCNNPKESRNYFLTGYCGQCVSS